MTSGSRPLPAAIGVIGCGAISDAYFKGVGRSPYLRMAGCSSRTMASAEAKGGQYGVPAMSVEALLSDPAIEVVINLTPPAAHDAISRSILEAGKHLYSEKPFSSSAEAAKSLLDLADSKGLKIGCAPDTFMGAAHQVARRLIDDGAIGKPVGGAVTVATAGPEGFHPNPAFLYQRGAGPVLDVGPYYLTQLVNLLGPVARVAAIGSRPRDRRLITSQPRAGQEIEVEVQTTLNGALLFESGANVAVTFSCDVIRHERPAMEIYGETGVLSNPDPNWFDGRVATAAGPGEWTVHALDGQPFGEANMTDWFGKRVANYRGIGLVDLVGAARAGREPRAGGRLVVHVLEVLLALERAGEGAGMVDIVSRCERPEPIAGYSGEEQLISRMQAQEA